MKKLLGLVVCFMMWLGSASAVFVEGLEDVPLPGGLTEIENASLNFGNEEIRFIENYFTSYDLNFENVCAFYSETLPQIGWKRTIKNKKRIAFERDGEVLEISKESAKPLVIRLTVKSKI